MTRGAEFLLILGVFVAVYLFGYWWEDYRQERRAERRDALPPTQTEDGR